MRFRTASVVRHMNLFVKTDDVVVFDQNYNGQYFLK